MESRGWSFAAFNEDLKSNRDHNADIEKFSLNSGAETDGCI